MAGLVKKKEPKWVNIEVIKNFKTHLKAGEKYKVGKATADNLIAKKVAKIIEAE